MTITPTPITPEAIGETIKMDFIYGAIIVVVIAVIVIAFFALKDR
jgi:hypothetical protein